MVRDAAARPENRRSDAGIELGVDRFQHRGEITDMGHLSILRGDTSRWRWAKGTGWRLVGCGGWCRNSTPWGFFCRAFRLPAAFGSPPPPFVRGSMRSMV